MSLFKHPIAEEDAEEELDGIFHEIRQVFRVSGVNLNFRTWAAYEAFFPALWKAMRPVAESRVFEESCDQVRALAARLADHLPRLDVVSSLPLGESQRFQIEAALRLYHYINPKLLVMTCVVDHACRHPAMAGFESRPQDHQLIPRGIPRGMYPMEMVEPRPDHPALRKTFRDIERTLGLTQINSDYRTLGLWPDYVITIWQRLKPVVSQSQYLEAAMAIREAAQQLAANVLPRLALTEDHLQLLGRHRKGFMDTTSHFTQLLPPLMINILLMSMEWRTAKELEPSPFPVEFHSPNPEMSS